MIKEPLVSVLTLGQSYEDFLKIVKPIAEGSESEEDFLNIMAKDFYVEDDYMAIVALIREGYEKNPLRGWLSQLYKDALGKVDRDE